VAYRQGFVVAPGAGVLRKQLMQTLISCLLAQESLTKISFLLDLWLLRIKNSAKILLEFSCTLFVPRHPKTFR